MTTIYSEAVKCPYCNTKVEITHLGSTNAFGAMDLDTRPPEMQRSTMRYWLQACSKCGLAVPDFAKIDKETLKYFRSDDFKKEHSSEKFKSLAANFWTAHLLAKKSGEINEALNHIHHAAWASDDLNDSVGSTRAREIFIETVNETANAPSFISPDEPLARYLILADINRRISRFEDAEKLSQFVVDNGEGFIQEVAELVINLCEKKDSACYNVQGQKVGY